MDLAKLYSDAYNASDITRESFFNIGGPHGFMRWGVYILMVIAFGYLAFTLIQRVRVWRQGKDELRTDYPEKRIWAVVKYVFLQLKIMRESYAGIMHAAFFFGFAGLFAVTMLIMIQDDFTELFFHYRFLTGNFYIYWSLFADLCGLVVLLGVSWPSGAVTRPGPRDLTRRRMDTFALVLITVISCYRFYHRSLPHCDVGLSGI